MQVMTHTLHPIWASQMPYQGQACRETLQHPTTLFLLVVHDTKRTQHTSIPLMNIHRIHCIILSIHKTNFLGRPLTVARGDQPMIIQATQGQAHIWIIQGSSILGNP